MNKKKIFISIFLTIVIIFGIALFSAFDDKKNNIQTQLRSIFLVL